jgi:hypothetical protein
MTPQVQEVPADLAAAELAPLLNLVVQLNNQLLHLADMVMLAERQLTALQEAAVQEK